MGTDLGHLQVEATSNLPDDWTEDLEDLRDGYPFESIRRNRSELEQYRPQQHCVLDSPSEFRTLAGHFGNQLVGWMDVRNLPQLSKLLPLPARFIVEELVQRNRDDIRHHLLEYLREHFPEQLLMTWHPTQNRTARQFLQSQNFSLARTAHHLGKKLDQTIDPSPVKLTDPVDLQKIVGNPSAYEVLPGTIPLLKTDLQPEYLRNILNLHRESKHRSLVVSRETPRNVLLLRGLESSPRIFGEFLLSEVTSQVLSELLELTEKNHADSHDYLEIILPDSRTKLVGALLDREFVSLTKRMFHLDVPESLHDYVVAE